MRLFSFDTETWQFEPGLLAPPVVCASIASEEPDSERLLLKSDGIAWFRWALEQRDVHLVGANLAYDLAVCCAAAPEIVDPVFGLLDEGRAHDVAIREALIDIELGTYGVDPQSGRPLDDDEGARYPLHLLVARHLGLDIKAEKKGDGWRKNYRALDGVPLPLWPAEAVDYPKRDARYTIDVFKSQRTAAATLANGGNLHSEPDQMRADMALHLAACWGLRTNPAGISALRERIESEWQANLVKFSAVGIYRPNGVKDTKRLQQLVSEAYLGEPPYTAPSERFPNGQIATDRDTLTSSGNELLEALGNSGRVNKYRSTYIDKIAAGVEVPINPRFNVLVSTTRCSSDYQQLPQEGGIREVHEARPDTVYCSVDYEGLELRTMAQRALWELGYSRMAEAMLAGKDVHTLAAAEFLGTSYDELLPKVKAKDKRASNFRALAKELNFGAGGGMSGATLSYQARKKGIRFCLLTGRAEVCGVERVPIRIKGVVKMACAECVAVGRELHAKWLQAWPEQKDLQDKAKQVTYGGARVDVMIPGAQILRGACGYTQILNTPFQGLGAVGAKLATWRVSRAMYAEHGPLRGSRLVLMVHDELISEMQLAPRWKGEQVLVPVPGKPDEQRVCWTVPERTHEAAHLKAEIMVQAMRETTPDLAPAVKAEPALSYIMSKGAATLYDERGRLLVWTPEIVKAA